MEHIKKAMFFYKSDCPNCPKGKEIFQAFCERHPEINVIQYSIESVGGLTEAAYRGILSVPTVVLAYDDKEVIYDWDSISSELITL